MQDINENNRQNILNVASSNDVEHEDAAAPQHCRRIGKSVDNFKAITLADRSDCCDAKMVHRKLYPIEGYVNTTPMNSSLATITNIADILIWKLIDDVDAILNEVRIFLDIAAL